MSLGYKVCFPQRYSKIPSFLPSEPPFAWREELWCLDAVRVCFEIESCFRHLGLRSHVSVPLASRGHISDPHTHARACSQCTAQSEEIRGESTRGHTVIGILVYGNLLELSNNLPRKPTSFHAQGSQRMTTPGGSAPGLLGSAASVTVPPAAAAAASAAAAER